MHLHTRIFVPCRVLDGRLRVAFRGGDSGVPRVLAFRSLRDANEAVALGMVDAAATPIDAARAPTEVMHTSTYDLMEDMHSFSVDVCEVCGMPGRELTTVGTVYAGHDSAKGRMILERAWAATDFFEEGAL